MRKILLAAAFVGLASNGAAAMEAQNGLQLNGLQLNGLQLNGLPFNGFTLNHIAWNVITFNAARPEDAAIFDALADLASGKLSD